MIVTVCQMLDTYLFLLDKYLNDFLVELLSFFGHQHHEYVVLCAVFRQYVRAVAW